MIKPSMRRTQGLWRADEVFSSCGGVYGRCVVSFFLRRSHDHELCGASRRCAERDGDPAAICRVYLCWYATGYHVMG